jgi:hypothetical protein
MSSSAHEYAQDLLFTTRIELQEGSPYSEIQIVDFSLGDSDRAFREGSESMGQILARNLRSTAGQVIQIIDLGTLSSTMSWGDMGDGISEHIGAAKDNKSVVIAHAAQHRLHKMGIKIASSVAGKFGVTLKTSQTPNDCIVQIELLTGLTLTEKERELITKSLSKSVGEG